VGKGPGAGGGGGGGAGNDGAELLLSVTPFPVKTNPVHYVLKGHYLQETTKEENCRHTPISEHVFSRCVPCDFTSLIGFTVHL
jgi:hypothetical protein